VTNISVTPRTIMITYPFLELLLGGHVARAQRTGVLGAASAEQWWIQLREAHQAGTFVYGFHGLIVAGVKGGRRN
jgi:hypothetical protein